MSVNWFKGFWFNGPNDLGGGMTLSTLPSWCAYCGQKLKGVDDDCPCLEILHLERTAPTGEDPLGMEPIGCLRCGGPTNIVEGCENKLCQGHHEREGATADDLSLALKRLDAANMELGRKRCRITILEQRLKNIRDEAQYCVTGCPDDKRYRASFILGCATDLTEVRREGG